MPVQFVRGRRPMLVQGVGKHELRPTIRSKKLSNKLYLITGITKDSTGAILGNCVVNLFYTNTNILAGSIISDANGNFSFNISPGATMYIIAYKAGSPDVSGGTVNTLVSAYA